MSLFIAFFLGVIQGLTEFFPVSSSAHLKLTKMLFGVSEIPLIFDLSCHLGTLFALIWFFKQKIFDLLKKDREKLVHFFIALLPLIPSYFLLAPIREWASKPEFLGLFWMLTGSILFLGQKKRSKAKPNLLKEVFLIGTMQSAALIPGISRSASTISCAQMLGWEPKDAVYFSFMLAIPTIIGGNLVEIHHLWKKGAMIQLMNIPCFIGFMTSMIVGLLVIRFAIQWLEKGNLKIFARYCMILGVLANIYFYGIQ